MKSFLLLVTAIFFAIAQAVADEPMLSQEIIYAYAHSPLEMIEGDSSKSLLMLSKAFAVAQATPAPKPFWLPLITTDPPEHGTSGYFAVNIALQSLLSGKPIPPNIRRELEAAAADKANREAAAELLY